MVNVITAPEEFVNIDIFLAGGITDCPDWQQRAIGLLSLTGLTVANPRRPEGLAKTGGAARRQIAWEHAALSNANVVLFHFPKTSSMCPITLFELGKMLGNGKPVAVSVDPGYPRQFDVIEQCRLEEIPVYADLNTCVAEATRLARRAHVRGD